MKRLALALLLSAATLNAATPHAPDAAASVVNINTATVAQLGYLPYVGAVTAARIVAYRSEHGQFRQASDLLQVKGIGEKKLAAMLPFVALAGQTTATAKIKGGAK